MSDREEASDKKRAHASGYLSIVSATNPISLCSRPVYVIGLHDEFHKWRKAMGHEDEAQGLKGSKE